MFCSHKNQEAAGKNHSTGEKSVLIKLFDKKYMGDFIDFMEPTHTLTNTLSYTHTPRRSPPLPTNPTVDGATTRISPRLPYAITPQPRLMQVGFSSTNNTTEYGTSPAPERYQPTRSSQGHP